MGASTTVGPRGWPERSPTPGSDPTRRSACTSTTRTSTSRRSTRAFKIRGVPVNVNYRYLDDELWYLLDNADAEVLFFHTSLGDRVDRVRERLPKLKLLVEVDDGGARTLDGAVALRGPDRAHDPMPRIERREDDIYMLYTGGTTGMPKGVMYAHGGFTSSFVDPRLRGDRAAAVPTDAGADPRARASLRDERPGAGQHPRPAR